MNTFKRTPVLHNKRQQNRKIKATISELYALASPPQSILCIETCPFRNGNTCHHALNYLRQSNCVNYCIPQLDTWMREILPEFNESQIIEKVRNLALKKANSREKTGKI